MTRPIIPSRYFVIVIVRKARHFLLVQENRPGQPWFLPGGGMEPGETLEEAAQRETLEEAGIAVMLEGIASIRHGVWPDGMNTVHVTYVARPADDATPKQVADKHSLRAAWLTLDELSVLPMRSPSLPGRLADVAAGAPIHPLSLLQSRRRDD